MPTESHEDLLRELYAAFNARDVETCLAGMTEDVDWANAWEGGRVVGRDAVRDYWRRQWAAIDSSAEPTAVTQRPDGTVEVAVHRLAPAHPRHRLNHAPGRHVEAFPRDLVARLTVED